MVGGVNDVVIQPLPRGAGLVEIVRICRSHAQEEGEKEGEKTFLRV